MRTQLGSHPRYTPRLELRQFRRRDLDPLMEAITPSINELYQWLPWAHLGYSRRDALIFLRDSMNAWQEGRAFDFSIRPRELPDHHIGNVSVWYTSKHSGVGEVGYWIRSDEVANGYATEATARILEIAFDELSMHRVVLRIAVGNIASERVAEKLGFSQEGILRDELKVHGTWLDHTVWGLLESEYRSALDRYTRLGWVVASG